MSEAVATVDGTESPEAVEPEATPPAEDVATIKRRLAGKDQALTRAAKERDEYRSEAERLRNKIAEYEQSNMTELERLQQRLAAAEAAANKAQEEARRHALARKSPVYSEFLDHIAGIDLNSEEAAEAFEEFVQTRFAKASRDDDTEPEPRIDPNRPRKTTPESAQPRTSEDIIKEMAKLGDGVFAERG